MTHHPTNAARVSAALLLLGLVCVPTAATAQMGLLPPIITGTSHADAAVLVHDGVATDQRIAVGAFLFDESFDVAPDRQVMVHSPSGRVTLVFIGPARATVSVKDDEIDLLLTSGRVMAASDIEPAEQPVHFRMERSGNSGLLVDAAPGRGWTFAMREGDHVEIGFDGLAPQTAELPVVTSGLRANLQSGRRVTIEGGKTQIQELGNWLEQSGFMNGELTQKLCIASARSVRDRVQQDFVENLVVWDKRIQARAVIEALDVEEYQAEVRQVTVSVTPQIQSSTTRSTSPQTPSFAAANEVPTLSPAAISVGGVTAVNLNENARALLTRTQSRGLGFNGLRQLAISGFGPGGRAVGPAGLGALP